MKKFFKTTFRILNWLAIVALLLSYLAPFISPKYFWPISFFGLTFKAILIGFCAILFFGFVFKTRMTLINIAILLVGLPFIQRTYSINTDVSSEVKTRFMSFNVYGFGVNRNINTSKSINHYLETHSIDLAVFQEWRYGSGRISKELFPHQLGFPFINSKRVGLYLVSKYPIVNSGIIPFTNVPSSVGGFADILINNTTVRIYAIHLETTRVKSEDYHVLKKLEFDSVSTYKAKNLAQRLKYSMQKRAQQVDDIKNHMKDCPYPSIIMGDLNDTPQSYAYQQLLEGKNDAFVEAGHGFEATYLKPFPILRIDFILADKSIDCLNYGSTDSIYSDHKLIFADLLINK